jgi:cell division protein FtsB
MTGLGIPANAGSAPGRKSRGPRLRLPATRAGITWMVALVVIGGLLAIQVGRQVYANYSITQHAAGYRQQIADIEAQNGRLRQQLDYLRSDAYISAEAKRLANLGRSGDRLLIIPPGSEASLPPSLQVAPRPAKPLLEQWLDLFFGS